MAQWHIGQSEPDSGAVFMTVTALPAGESYWSPRAPLVPILAVASEPGTRGIEKGKIRRCENVLIMTNSFNDIFYLLD